MIYYEGEEILFSTACGVIVNDEYILWSSWQDRSLYKLYLGDKHIEYVRSVSEIDFIGQRIANMLKYKDKVYLISYGDGYEIIEYDLESDELRQVYSKAQKEIYSVKAFLIDEKIYIFPFQMDSSICVYSIRENKADYIKWETLLPGIQFDLKNDGVISMCHMGDIIYGVVYNTPYIFEIKIKPQIECRVNRMNDGYKLATIDIYDGIKYVTLAEKEILLCIKPNGKIEELELISKRGKKNGILYWFWGAIAHGNKVFLLPNDDNDDIQVVDTLTGESELLEFPDKFSRRNRYRLFWGYCLLGDKAYLLPLTANGLVVLDMCDCKMEYFSGWKFGIRDFLKVGFCEETAKEKITDTVGETIYNIVEREAERL
ncbi:MAG: hypothetical protein NC313_04005 [Butyrivibrio sp.]|nr:hypothetical protein [Butyrivibrio sp.]